MESWSLRSLPSVARPETTHRCRARIRLFALRVFSEFRSNRGRILSDQRVREENSDDLLSESDEIGLVRIKSSLRSNNCPFVSVVIKEASISLSAMTRRALTRRRLTSVSLSRSFEIGTMIRLKSQTPLCGQHGEEEKERKNALSDSRRPTLATSISSPRDQTEKRYFTKKFLFYYRGEFSFRR